MSCNSLYNTRRLHSLISPRISSEKSLNVAELLSSWWLVKFSKILIFCLKILTLSLVVNTTDCFPFF